MTTNKLPQDNLFSTDEGNAYFHRNRTHLENFDPDDDLISQAIEQYGLKPKNIIEYGCALGSRLAYLSKKYEAKVIGIEPGKDAITACEQAWPQHTWLPGTISDHRPLSDHCADLAICCYVLHWVDRSFLFSSLQRIDRELNEGGYLIINDFWPAAPGKRRYHHRDDVDIYTWKQDYAQAFIGSGRYDPISITATDHTTGKIGFHTSIENRSMLAVLRKRNATDYPEI